MITILSPRGIKGIINIIYKINKVLFMSHVNAYSSDMLHKLESDFRGFSGRSLVVDDEGNCDLSSLLVEESEMATMSLINKDSLIYPLQQATSPRER